jgi:hypothetical protein
MVPNRTPEILYLLFLMTFSRVLKALFSAICGRSPVAINVTGLILLRLFSVRILEGYGVLEKSSHNSRSVNRHIETETLST